MEYHSLLPHVTGQHDQQQDSSEGSRDLQGTGERPRVNETLPSQQPSQASGAILQNQPTSPVAAANQSKFGKQCITCDHLGHIHACTCTCSNTFI